MALPVAPKISGGKQNNGLKLKSDMQGLSNSAKQKPKIVGKLLKNPGSKMKGTKA